MIDFFSEILGNYTPITNIDGSIAIGLAGVDFPYIFRALFFALVVYSVLRCIGGLICRTY